MMMMGSVGGGVDVAVSFPYASRIVASEPAVSSSKRIQQASDHAYGKVDRLDQNAWGGGPASKLSRWLRSDSEATGGVASRNKFPVHV